MNKILLLEDEESVNRGIAFSLEKEGYEVTACENLKEARLCFCQNSFELVLCDINLPDGNGRDFIKWIRSSSNIHIICLTALDQELDQVMAYEAGADDYITKPFSLSVLKLKIAAYFKKQEKENGVQILKSGNIKFNTKELKIIKDEEEISLTKNEWKMLVMFMTNARQILSKKQLLENLFDIDGEFVDENTIAVNVRRLREKVENDLSNPEYIKNIRGLGYVWNKECTSIFE